MLAAENWCIKVKDKVYGPYTKEQLLSFARQGRLAPWSIISPAGGQTWREARSEPAFAALFDSQTAGATHAKGQRVHDSAFGKRTDWNAQGANAEDHEPATPADGGITALGPEFRKRYNQRRAANAPHTANFIIVFDVVSGAASRVQAAVMSLGPAFRVAENVWSVSCELTAVGVRNAIAPYLRGSESIFVIDTTRGRTSWRNYAPETHAKITAAYLTSRVA